MRGLSNDIKIGRGVRRVEIGYQIGDYEGRKEDDQQEERRRRDPQDAYETPISVR
jgi:hypothetical protein